MMFIGRQILIRKRDESLEASVRVSKKVQASYKKMCKKLKLKYKFLADAPKVYRGIKDDRDIARDEYSSADMGYKTR